MTQVHLQPIGVARTPFSEPRGIPRQGGGPARIEVFPPFRPALLGLERCSHLWIIGFFHTAQRDVLQARPRKTSPDAPARGVFGMRAPVRPNPLGLTCARLLEVQSDALVVDRLDFQDQTPIVDIKPYSPGWDLVPSATSAHRYDPSRYARSDLLEALARDAEHALGAERANTALIRSMIDGLAALVADQDVDLRRPDTRFVLPFPDGRVDLLLCAAGATFGNERLELGSLPDDSVIHVHAHGGLFRVVVSASFETRVLRV